MSFYKIATVVSLFTGVVRAEGECAPTFTSDCSAFADATSCMCAVGETAFTCPTAHIEYYTYTPETGFSYCQWETGLSGDFECSAGSSCTDTSGDLHVQLQVCEIDKAAMAVRAEELEAAVTALQTKFDDLTADYTQLDRRRVEAEEVNHNLNFEKAHLMREAFAREMLVDDLDEYIRQCRANHTNLNQTLWLNIENRSGHILYLEESIAAMCDAGDIESLCGVALQGYSGGVVAILSPWALASAAAALLWN